MFTVYIKDTLTGKRSKHVLNTKTVKSAKLNSLRRERKLRCLDDDYKFLEIESIHQTIIEDKQEVNYNAALNYLEHIDNKRFR